MCDFTLGSTWTVTYDSEIVLKTLVLDLFWFHLTNVLGFVFSFLTNAGHINLSASNPESSMQRPIKPPSPAHTSLPVGPTQWHRDLSAAHGYSTSHHPSLFHESQRHLLMGNKHGMPGENVRSRAPSTGTTAEGEPSIDVITGNNNNRTKEEGSNISSNASSGVGSESPDKNSPGVPVRSGDTADWLAQIGTGRPPLHHGRPAVTGDRTPPSSIVTQGIAVSATTGVPSSDPRHYYSSKDLVYTSSPADPALISSLQYSTHVTPSTVSLASLPGGYSPYLSPYALPYVGYPHSALTQGIESYSAMLASMGNQVQQAQSHIPASPYLTPGMAIPGSYLGIPGLTPSIKSGLPDGATPPTSVAYIGGQVIPTASLLPTSHSLSSGILSAGFGGHLPPGSVTIKTEDRPGVLPSAEQLQRQEEELKRYLDSREKHAAAMPREARVSPFERRTSPTMGSTGLPEHVKTGRDSGVPESPRHVSIDLSPSGKVDSTSLRQQYYRDIGMGASVKLESGNESTAQTYLSSSKHHDVHSLHTEQHHHGPEGSVHAHMKSSVISRTPPVPSSLHMSSSRLLPSRQHTQSSPHQSSIGLMLSPSPQVRPSPTIMTTSLQPTSVAHHSHLPSVTAMHQEVFPPLTPTRTSEPHRFDSSTEASAVGAPRDKHHRLASSTRERSAESTDRHGKSPLTNVPSYFTRGSIIQLANGELRRVEDLRTEDFVQSAELTEGLKIDSSTVLRVEEDHSRGVAHIGFLVGEQKAQVCYC